MSVRTIHGQWIIVTVFIIRAVSEKNTIVNCPDVPRLHDINTETDRANGEQNISRSPVLETETEKVFVSRIFI